MFLYRADGSAVLVAVPAENAVEQHHYNWMWIPTCALSAPTNLQLSCAHTGNGCPDPRDHLYWVYYTDTSLVPPDGWHRVPTTYCLGPTSTVPVAVLQADVQRQFRNLPLPRGTISVEPPRAGVVNLPVLAFTNTPSTRIFHVTALGAAVTLTATPQRWVWRWGAGAPVTTNGPGAPYPTCQQATSSCAAFTYTEPGSYGPISVTVSWTATYTVAGVAQIFSITTPVDVGVVGPVVRVDDAPSQLVTH
ncbi:MAG TPA: hypothetical protein VNG13_06880 [Mycobacteriales bacterium]|nr:hypothetical protein [Mycobacteriales bacterium]